MATATELAQLTQETIAYYDNKFKEDKFPVPGILQGRKHLVSQYMRVWKFFDGLLEPEKYCKYAEIIFNSIELYDYYSEFEPEVIDRCEIDKSLKNCVLALIDMELDDLKVEVKKLKNSSKLSSGGVSVKAAKAVKGIKERVISLVINNHIKLDNVTETKCQLIQWLYTGN
jgi:hypothetical protein